MDDLMIIGLLSYKCPWDENASLFETCRFTRGIRLKQVDSSNKDDHEVELYIRLGEASQSPLRRLFFLHDTFCCPRLFSLK